LRPITFERARPCSSRQRTRQEDLAHGADITTGTLSLIERGHANPTWSTVKGVTAALGVSMGELGKLVDQLDG
jgi:DNA-binding XRE family transcriptional regulator